MRQRRETFAGILPHFSQRGPQGCGEQIGSADWLGFSQVVSRVRVVKLGFIAGAANFQPGEVLVVSRPLLVVRCPLHYEMTVGSSASFETLTHWNRPGSTRELALQRWAGFGMRKSGGGQLSVAVGPLPGKSGLGRTLCVVYKI